MSRICLLGLLTCMSFVSASANAAIIVVDFNGADGLPSSYTEDGFKVSSPSHLHLDDNLYQHTGGSEIYNYGMADASAFDLVSFDITSLSFPKGSAINFVSSNGAVFTLTETGTHTFSGSGWSNITGFSVDLTGDYREYYIDNINIRTPAATEAAVPEPASLAIWGLGALGCAVAAYRRKKQAA